MEKRNQFLDIARQLNVEMDAYKKEQERYQEVQGVVDSIMEQENTAPNGPTGLSKRMVMEEIIETEKMLNKLRKEQGEVSSLVQDRVTRNAELERQVKTVKVSSGLKAIDAKKAKASRSRSLLHSSTTAASEGIASMEHKVLNQEALLETLQKFTGVQVHSAEVSEEGGMVVRVSVGPHCEVIIALDSKLSVASLDIIRAKVEIDVAKVLCEACILPSPQDLRQVIFVLGSMQGAADAIETDLVELRKLLLVRRISSSIVQVTFSSGVSARLACSDCYPEVPNGVHVLGLDGVGGWTPQELESLRKDASCNIFRTLIDAVAYLAEELA